ncbi:hypothetical protein ART_1030 [Arthrobacter sp. PAMC 25486]|uniref:hypothetical protein n=1 Tax=Arthrobacter sp. PAMC 25486 TaxID=1494608 RepID=UPI000535D190|nr:hypothetical protein [Arthrobacter sp. PAMC 25486]AIY00629.1 hypothetical protein ART_1030 [Arthrobacter sp. PAMC 25486]
MAIDGRNFEFTPALCAVDFNDSILVHGPGKEVGAAEPSYLDVDITFLDGETHGEFRIDIGVDGQFRSSEDMLAAGDRGNGALAMAESGSVVTLTAPGWNSRGDDVGEASLTFDCG